MFKSINPMSGKVLAEYLPMSSEVVDEILGPHNKASVVGVKCRFQHVEG